MTGGLIWPWVQALWAGYREEGYSQAMELRGGQAHIAQDGIAKNEAMVRVVESAGVGGR